MDWKKKKKRYMQNQSNIQKPPSPSLPIPTTKHKEINAYF